MQVETTQAAATLSLPVVLGIGWAIAAGILVYGLLKHRARYSQVGFALVGLMTLVTPLAWYAYAVGRPDLYPIGVADVLVLGFVAFPGGIVAVLGFVLPRVRATASAKR